MAGQARKPLRERFAARSGGRVAHRVLPCIQRADGAPLRIDIQNAVHLSVNADAVGPVFLLQLRRKRQRFFAENFRILHAGRNVCAVRNIAGLQ